MFAMIVGAMFEHKFALPKMAYMKFKNSHACETKNDIP